MCGRKPLPAKLANVPDAAPVPTAGAVDTTRPEVAPVKPTVIAAAAAGGTTEPAVAPPAAKRADIAPVVAQHAPIGEASAVAKRLAADIQQALSQGEMDLLSEDAIQALMAAVCRSYAARIEAGDSFPPLAPRSPVTSTDVMVTASGLLKSANLAVFELGMWQSWTGR
jgi:hypothetical protein